MQLLRLMKPYNLLEAKWKKGFKHWKKVKYCSHFYWKSTEMRVSWQGYLIASISWFTRDVSFQGPHAILADVSSSDEQLQIQRGKECMLDGLLKSMLQVLNNFYLKILKDEFRVGYKTKVGLFSVSSWTGLGSLYPKSRVFVKGRRSTEISNKDLTNM